MRQHRLHKFLTLLTVLSATSAVDAQDVQMQSKQPLSRVQVEDTAGAPLRGVAARIALNDSRTHIINLFSDSQGRYSGTLLRERGVADNVASDALEFVARGYGLVSTTNRPSAEGSNLLVAKMSRDALRPDDLPAAAWLQSWPQNSDAAITIMRCTGCHQFPGKAQREFANQIAAMEESAQIDQWRRKLQDMRFNSLLVAGSASKRRFTTIDEDWRMGKNAIISARVEKIIVPFLMANLPRNFSQAQWNPAWDMGAAQATEGVSIEEFWLKPGENNWYREVVYSPRTKNVIGVDLGGDRLFALDPANGALEWIAIPVEAKRVAPHTIERDKSGLIWVTLEDVNGVGAFDPVKKHWTIYRDIFGGSYVSHDLATDSHDLVAKDRKGRVWITLVSHNHIAALDPKTGRADVFALPERTDGTGEPTLPYGAVMTADRQFIWVATIGDDKVHKVSTATGKVVLTLDYPNGAAPRRLAIDTKDRVWVNLVGGNALGLIEGDKRTKEFPLPMAVSNPYTALWDPVRQSVWIGTSNASEILEFDPKTATFRRYMLPAHREAYIRQLSRNPDTGDIWTSYASRIGEEAATAVIKIVPETIKNSLQMRPSQ